MLWQEENELAEEYRGLPLEQRLKLATDGTEEGNSKEHAQREGGEDSRWETP